MRPSFAATLLSVSSGIDQDIMNAGGVPYSISNPPGSTANWRGQPGDYSTNFFKNVDGKVEYFTVYGEVRTKYSQVYWTRNANIDLPSDLVARFQGKTMAITGYEVDQVVHDGPQIGTSTRGEALGGFACFPECEGSENDMSIPEYHAYNHHYFGYLMGEDAELYDLPAMQQQMPNPTWTGVHEKSNTHGFPTHLVFKENPGGEFRKSYHGYPKGYAQLLHSPNQAAIEPMQIDTHNRDFGLTEEVGYKPSFMPQILKNRTETDHVTPLNPLIECPCSDRIDKHIETTQNILVSGTCSRALLTEAECEKSVSALAVVSSSSSVNNVSAPAGCLMIPDEGRDTYQAVFNIADTSKPCAFSTYSWEGPINGSRIDCQGSCLAPDQQYGCTGEFDGQCTWDSPEDAKENCDKWGQCEGFFCSSRWNGKLLCFGRKNSDVGQSIGADQIWRKVYDTSLRVQSYLGQLVNVSVEYVNNQALLTLSGPGDVWFGVAFGADAMADRPYTIVVDGDGNVSERKIDDHKAGDQLQASIIVQSSTVEAGIRTLKLSRPIVGKTKDHWSFPTKPGAVSAIVAVGSGPTLAYHKSRNADTLMFLPNSEACLCQPDVTKYMTYMDTTRMNFHGYNCIDAPRSDMKAHGDGTGRNVENQACNTETYHGGLQCCKHTFFLTDRDQAALIPDKTDVYFLKWRFYFQEYTPKTASVVASHQHLHHWVFLIDLQINDYEEDNANYGTLSVGKITANLTAKQMGLEDTPSSYTGITPLVMTPHCHAPSCIREELWNADTGDIICNVSAMYGSQKYGDTNRHFNEPGYVTIPPCIYGAQPGLQEPFTLSPSTNLMAVKYFNNTYRHLGLMAQWTGLMVYDSDPYIV